MIILFNSSLGCLMTCMDLPRLDLGEGRRKELGPIGGQGPFAAMVMSWMGN